VAAALAGPPRALWRLHHLLSDRLDEHGLKIERICPRERHRPADLCDGVAAEFKRSGARAGITTTASIIAKTTTEPEHTAAVAEMWKRNGG